MKEKEKIKVYICTVKGETVCMCMKNNKKCPKHCEEDIVTRDRFRAWESTMKRNKYGE